MNYSYVSPNGDDQIEQYDSIIHGLAQAFLIASFFNDVDDEWMELLDSLPPFSDEMYALAREEALKLYGRIHQLWKYEPWIVVFNQWKVENPDNWEYCQLWGITTGLECLGSTKTGWESMGLMPITFAIGTPAEEELPRPSVHIQVRCDLIWDADESEELE